MKLASSRSKNARACVACYADSDQGAVGLKFRHSTCRASVTFIRRATRPRPRPRSSSSCQELERGSSAGQVCRESASLERPPQRSYACPPGRAGNRRASLDMCAGAGAEWRHGGAARAQTRASAERPDHIPRTRVARGSPRFLSTKERPHGREPRQRQRQKADDTLVAAGVELAPAKLVRAELESAEAVLLKLVWAELESTEPVSAELQPVQNLRRTFLPDARARPSARGRCPLFRCGGLQPGDSESAPDSLSGERPNVL